MTIIASSMTNVRRQRSVWNKFQEEFYAITPSSKQLRKCSKQSLEAGPPIANIHFIHRSKLIEWVFVVRGRTCTNTIMIVGSGPKNNKTSISATGFLWNVIIWDFHSTDDKQMDEWTHLIRNYFIIVWFWTNIIVYRNAGDGGLFVVISTASVIIRSIIKCSGNPAGKWNDESFNQLFPWKR